MPAAYVRMLAYAWGEPVAARACLLGEIFDPRQAFGLGMFQELADGDQLLERAVAVAEMTPEDCLEPYAFTKRAAQAAALRDIAEIADPLDQELPDGMTADSPATHTAATGSSSKAPPPPGEYAWAGLADVRLTPVPQLRAGRDQRAATDRR